MVSPPRTPRLGRGLTRVAMLLLLIGGAACLHFSIWPSVWEAMAGGARVKVAWRSETILPPCEAAACWTAALWLALRDRGRR